MLLSTLRRVLRRRVHDLDAQNWSDADLNEILNAGFQQVQKRILVVESTPWIAEDTRNITAGTSDYRKPPSMWYEIEVAVSDGSIPGGFRPIARRDYNRVATSASGSELDYAHLGQFIHLSPTPSVTTAGGLRIIYVPVLSMDQDDEAPAIPAPLHMAIVLYAQIFLMGETEEGIDKLQSALEMVMGDLGTYYYQHGKEAPAVIPDIDNGRGGRASTGQRYRNGIYIR